MDELIIRDEAKLSKVMYNLQTLQLQKEKLEEQIDTIKGALLSEMEKEGLKQFKTDKFSLNNSARTKKTLAKDGLMLYLKDLGMLQNYLILDEKRCIEEFPDFVSEEFGKSFLTVKYQA